MKRFATTLCVLLAFEAISVGQEVYTLTNISGWTPAQLATLPHFDRYVPLLPDGATGDFTPRCANGLGLVAGTRGSAGAFVLGGTQTEIEAFGTWHWSYWTCDAHDCHFYWGTVEHSPARAVNVLGQVVGFANLGGVSTEASTYFNWDDHLYLYDTTTGQKADLTPTAHRCDAADLNDRGVITGYWADESTYHPFRRSADGVFTDFVFTGNPNHTITPHVINNSGHVAGVVSIWTTPRQHIPFLSVAGSDIEPLPYPDLLNNYNATITDINDHDILVGYYHKADNPYETTALRWSNQGGTWVAEPLIELLVDNQNFILDRAIAVNDAGYIICTGHADGGPDNQFNTHTFLLTPLSFPPPTVTTLTPVSVTSTSATLRAKLNAANLATTAMFQHGTTTSYGTDTPISPLNGTLPVLAQHTWNALSPHTTYHYRATATNSAGTTEGADESFTTAWDWPTWRAAHLGTTEPDADSNQNGIPDLVDYATGNGPPLSCALTNGQLNVTFRRLRNADGITLVVQVSDDLITWNDGSTYSLLFSTPNTAYTTELSRLADGPETEWITVAIPSATPRLFVRLKVILH